MRMSSGQCVKVAEKGTSHIRAKKIAKAATTSVYMLRPRAQESAFDLCRNSPLMPATIAANASSAARRTRLTMRSRAIMLDVTGCLAVLERSSDGLLPLSLSQAAM